MTVVQCRGMRDRQKLCWTVRHISNYVPLAWGHFQALVSAQPMCNTEDVQQQLALEHKEKLPGAGVVMLFFRSAGRH